MHRLGWVAGKAGVIAALLLATACSSEADEPDTVEVPITKPAAAPDGDGIAAEDTGATPMEDRVARLGLLNKRNNVSEEIELKPGEARAIGPVTIRLSACERTAPWELPQEVGAFVQVDIAEGERGAAKRVFSGWLFRESPSLNVVEHPIYDVWVKDCTMAFPGEEAAPAARPSPAPAQSPTAAPIASPAAPAATD